MNLYYWILIFYVVRIYGKEFKEFVWCFFLAEILQLCKNRRIYEKFVQLIQAIDTYVWFAPLPTQTTLYWNKKFKNKIRTQNEKYMYSRKHCRVLTYSFKSEELNSVANRYVA